VLKRLLVHAGAFNLGLWMRTLFGVGTPHSLQGRAIALITALCAFIDDALIAIGSSRRDHLYSHSSLLALFVVQSGA
jgi:hypothetical protein